MLEVDDLAVSPRMRKDDGGRAVDGMLVSTLVDESVNEGGRVLDSFRESVRPLVCIVRLSWSAVKLCEDMFLECNRKSEKRLSELLRRCGSFCCESLII